MRPGPFNKTISRIEYDLLPAAEQELYTEVWVYDHPIYGGVDAFESDYSKYSSFTLWSQAMHADTVLEYRLDPVKVFIKSRLDDRGKFKMKATVRVQESKHIAINFYMSYEKRAELIDSITNKQEVSIDMLAALSELIRTGELNKNDYTALPQPPYSE